MTTSESKNTTEANRALTLTRVSGPAGRTVFSYCQGGETNPEEDVTVNVTPRATNILAITPNIYPDQRPHPSLGYIEVTLPPVDEVAKARIAEAVAACSFAIAEAIRDSRA